MRNVLLKSLLAATSLAMTVPVAQSATTSNTFNVSVTLTSMCEATNSGSTTVAFGTYTAFQQSALSATGVSLTFRCTRGFAPTGMAFDTVNGTAAGVGVLGGLQYALTAATPVTTNGTAASATSIGTGDTVTYGISGSMPADQAGACSTSSCTPTAQQRTLIVTF